jgi:hypothetical protein
MAANRSPRNITYAKASRTAHGTSTEVDPVAIDLLVLDRPFDGLQDTLFRGLKKGFVLIFALLDGFPPPPPVRVQGSAIEVQGAMLLGHVLMAMLGGKGFVDCLLG